jgi:2-isopropylmalate synthase
MSDRLIIFDTTLRDGEQAPASRCESRKSPAGAATRGLGVDLLEAGFPLPRRTTPRRAPHRIALEAAVVAALRVRAGDIDRPAGRIAPARRRAIHTFIATSDLHLSRKLG